MFILLIYLSFSLLHSAYEPPPVVIKREIRQIGPPQYDRYTPSEMQPPSYMNSQEHSGYMQQAPIRREIGMDNSWNTGYRQPPPSQSMQQHGAYSRDAHYPYQQQPSQSSSLPPGYGPGGPPPPHPSYGVPQHAYQQRPQMTAGPSRHPTAPYTR